MAGVKTFSVDTAVELFIVVVPAVRYKSRLELFVPAPGKFIEPVNQNLPGPLIVPLLVREVVTLRLSFVMIEILFVALMVRLAIETLPVTVTFPFTTTAPIPPPEAIVPRA